MLHETSHYDAGVLTSRDVYDDVAHTFTVFDGAGAQISQRPLTAEEIAKFAADKADVTAAATRTTNAASLRTKAQQALTTNATSLGHAAVPAGTLTTAQLSGIVRTLTDQVDALTRQNNALIRLGIGLLDDTTNT